MFTEIFCLFHPEITCSDNGECVHTEILEVIRGTHAVEKVHWPVDQWLPHNDIDMCVPVYTY